MTRPGLVPADIFRTISPPMPDGLAFRVSLQRIPFLLAVRIRSGIRGRVYIKNSSDSTFFFLSGQKKEREAKPLEFHGINTFPAAGLRKNSVRPRAMQLLSTEAIALGLSLAC